MLAHTGSKFAGYASVRGEDQISAAIADVDRAIEFGIRGFLIGDLGLLRVFRERQAKGLWPAGIHWKISAYVPAANPPIVQLLEELGASSVNIPSDLTVDQIHDIYVETMDASGGTIRIVEMHQLINAGAPLCVKFGLANAKTLYPAGAHTTDEAVKIAIAKARRAALAKEWLERTDPHLLQSFNTDSTAIPEV